MWQGAQSALILIFFYKSQQLEPLRNVAAHEVVWYPCHSQPSVFLNLQL